jgi:hypothetical protein
MTKFAWIFLGVLVALPLSGATVVLSEAGFVSLLTGGYYLEDFESLTPGDQGVATLPFTDGTFSYTASTFVLSPPPDLFVNSTFTNTMSTEDNENDLDFLITSGNVNAVGGNFFMSLADESFFGPPPVGRTFTLSLSDGTAQEVLVTGTADFIGFIADPGTFFTSLRVGAPDHDSTAVHPNADNLYVGSATAAAIPEPSSFALFGIGLVAIGWKASRAQRRRNG